MKSPQLYPTASAVLLAERVAAVDQPGIRICSGTVVGAEDEDDADDDDDADGGADGGTVTLMVTLSPNG